MNTKKLSKQAAADIINGVMIAASLKDSASPKKFTKGNGTVLLINKTIECGHVINALRAIGFEVRFDTHAGQSDQYANNFIWIN
jgi:hypothetical protein